MKLKNVVISMLQYIKENPETLQENVTHHLIDVAGRKTIYKYFKKIMNAELIKKEKINRRKGFTLTEKGEAFLQNPNFKDLGNYKGSDNKEENLSEPTNASLQNETTDEGASESSMIILTPTLEEIEKELDSIQGLVDQHAFQLSSQKMSEIKTALINLKEKPDRLFNNQKKMRKRSAKSYCNTMNALIRDLQYKTCFSGYGSEIFFEFDSQKSVSLILNKIRALSWNRGWDRFFGLGTYLGICSDNDFDDLRPDLKIFLNSLKPKEFKDHRKKLFESMEKYKKNRPRGKSEPASETRKYIVRILKYYVKEQEAFQGLYATEDQKRKNVKRKRYKNIASSNKKSKTDHINQTIVTEESPASNEVFNLEKLEQTQYFSSLFNLEGTNALINFSKSEKTLRDLVLPYTAEIFPNADFNFQPLISSEQTSFEGTKSQDNKDEEVDWESTGVNSLKKTYP